MGTLDTVLGIGAIVGVAAYLSNFSGFRDWVTNQVNAQPQPLPPDNGGGGGGGSTGKPTATPTNVPLGKCFSYNGLNCWRNYKCGGGQVSICGKATCDAVRASWVANYGCKTAPAPKPQPTPTPPPYRTQPCTLKCTGCFDATGYCSCKLNPNKLSHSDAYCKTTCGGYSFWTNYPCPNLGARTQVTVKGDCAMARTAWLARYGCKAHLARSYDSVTMQVPNI